MQVRKILIFGLIALGLTSCFTDEKSELHIGDSVVAYSEDGSIVGQVVGINMGWHGLVAVRACDGRYLSGSRNLMVKLPYEGPVCVPKL